MSKTGEISVNEIGILADDDHWEGKRYILIPTGSIKTRKQVENKKPVPVVETKYVEAVAENENLTI